MKEIFTLVKASPFSQMLGLSSSRFSQKLNNFKTKGYVQDFDENQRNEIKKGLIVLADLIRQEAEKL